MRWRPAAQPLAAMVQQLHTDFAREIEAARRRGAGLVMGTGGRCNIPLSIWGARAFFEALGEHGHREPPPRHFPV